MPPVAPVPTLTQEEALYWLALRMTPGLGTRKAGQLIDIFRSPRAVLRASRSELEAAGLSPAVAQSLASGCAFEDAASQQEKLAEAGAALVPVTDSRYLLCCAIYMMRLRCCSSAAGSNCWIR
jgi:DNA processing protein